MEKLATSRSIADEQKRIASNAIANIIAEAATYSKARDEKALAALAVDAAKAMRAGFDEINRAD